MTPAWHEMSAVAQGDAIARGDIDPRELCAHYFGRIEAHEGADAIYLRTMRERADAEAGAAARRVAEGRRLSRLDGVPISWKDIYDTAGVATEMGTPLLAGRVPLRDARALERAARAGLVCLGKTNTVQFALGGIGTNPATGTPPNAVMTDVPRAPGGSSSGAAASVAHRLAAAAIGSDTGGSVRIPAAWNRLVGLKTSFGAIPTEGVMPLSPTLDTVGPLCADVADAAALFAILAARPPVDLEAARLDGCRFPSPKTWCGPTPSRRSWPPWKARSRRSPPPAPMSNAARCPSSPKSTPASIAMAGSSRRKATSSGARRSTAMRRRSTRTCWRASTRAAA